MNSRKKEVFAATRRDECLAAANVSRHRISGNREDAARPGSADERIAFRAEAGEAGIVDPVLLHELELTLDAADDRDEEEAGDDAVLPIRAAPADQPMAVDDAPAVVGVVVERVARIAAPDMRAEWTSLAEAIAVEAELVVVALRLLDVRRREHETRFRPADDFLRQRPREHAEPGRFVVHELVESGDVLFELPRDEERAVRAEVLVRVDRRHRSNLLRVVAVPGEDLAQPHDVTRVGLSGRAPRAFEDRLRHAVSETKRFFVGVAKRVERRER